MGKDILLTIFTPAFNRAHTLPRTFESLQKQDCKDFIWLVVDDGSSDNTADLVKGWQKENNGFEIRYIFKENGGMHTAHNVAYANIDTELNVCVDSDDALSKGAVKKILSKWQAVKDDGYAGIIALDANMETGEVIGDRFPSEMTETTVVNFYAAGRSGDKKLIYRTDVINQYPPYPVFEGERYVSLAYKYRLIDQDYKLAVLDEVVCDVEYQADGSSGTMYKQYLKNPKGFAFWRKVCMQYPESKKRLFIDCVHYVSSSIIGHNKHFISESPKKFLTILAIPFGVALTVIIKKKARD
ncbi:MAG: glycosyltransferase family 2 protein [Eubacterium sp.]|nr:glycosyltransferase family 2 protein [Eubacterium sp.]